MDRRSGCSSKRRGILKGTEESKVSVADGIGKAGDCLGPETARGRPKNS